MHVEGFTREVPRFMRLADFFIGKPGRAASARRLAMGPSGDRRTQPLDAAPGALQTPIGWKSRVSAFHCAASGARIADAVRKMVDPERRCEFVKRVEQQRNRAVFEIPEILGERFLEKGV